MNTIACTNAMRARSAPRRRVPASVESISQRHALVFGKGSVSRFAELTIGIGSVGGLGAEILEKVVRLFPKKIVMIDSDTVSISNLNRLPGASLMDARQKTPKTHLAERQTALFNPRQKVEAIHGDFLDARNQRRFRQCDIVFSAFDRVAPRLAANQLCQAHGILLIDCGVGALVEDGRLQSAGAQVILVRPAGGFCLSCSGLYDPREAAADFMDEAERAAQEQLGYVRGAAIDAPQVYAFNAMAAAQAVWLLQLLVAGWDIPFDGIAIDAKNFTTRPWKEDHDHAEHCPVCGLNGYAMSGDAAPLLVRRRSTISRTLRAARTPERGESVAEEIDQHG